MNQDYVASLLVAWIDDLRYLQRNDVVKGTWAEVKARKVADQMLELLEELDPDKLVARYGEDFR